MSPAMAALRALVCALIATMWAGQAHAERRKVAVVNLDLSDQSAAKTLADELSNELFRHQDLNTLADPTDAAALKDPIDEPDRFGLDLAAQYQARTEAQVTNFDYPAAEQSAEDGQRALLRVAPSAAVLHYADLVFLRGQALVLNSKAQDAEAWFALCARIDPDRVPDPARYLPSVINTYAKAKAQTAAPGSITVDGTGDVWIDGRQVGVAPGGFSVPAGRHVVWLTGDERVVGGAPAKVEPAKATVVKIERDQIGRRGIVQRARITLAKSADATARAAAMNALAKLVGVEDAVLLQVSNDKVVVQTWRSGNVDRSPGFSALREHGKEKTIELLTPLAPPKKQDRKDDPPVIPVKPVVVKKWYQKTSWRVGIVAGVVAGVAAIYFGSKAGADNFRFDTNVGIENPGTVRQ